MPTSRASSVQEGPLVTAAVHPANIQDRDAAAITLKGRRCRFPWREKLFADAGYSGDKVRDALVGQTAPKLEIVKRPRDAEGFVLPPRPFSRFACKPLPGGGWVVERTFAWFGRNRRLYKDCERLTRSALACLYLATSNMLVRRCAKY